VGLERALASPGATGIELRDIAPNPAATYADLRVTSERGANLTLRVFSSDGRVVRTVASGYAAAGSSSWRLGTADLPAGVYYCVAESGGQRSVRKLMVVR
jgi:hypothetical protein